MGIFFSAIRLVHMLQTSKNRRLNNKKDGREKDSTLLSKCLDRNLVTLKAEFCYPENEDFVIRKVHIKALNKVGALIFLKGTIKSETVEKEILQPLTEREAEIDRKNLIEELISMILTVKTASTTDSLEDITKEIINGNTVLLIEGSCEAISMGTQGFEHKSIDKPTNENVLKGPKEAFIESALVNRSIIRRQLKNPKLVTESISIGQRGINNVFIMYIKDLTEDTIVENIRSKIKAIDVDTVQNTSILEQFIEERPYSLLPTVLFTERPDRVVSFLLEGHVALIMDNAPECLIAPATVWSFFHTGEDTYQRWAYGIFIRMIRVIAFLLATLTPALYIAITNFHQDMVPTDLILTIAGTREPLPLPAIVEVLIMDLSFELIREAGTRIPSTIGPTIGIVGALILGQAAVQANIVSPILIIVIAITGLASFAIPDISFTYLIRITKLIFLAFAGVFGLLGVMSFLTYCIAYMISAKSFGVPFLSPMEPHYKSSRDLILRPSLRDQFLRPFNLYPKDKLRADSRKRGGK
jgi:spore germination protein KA